MGQARRLRDLVNAALAEAGELSCAERSRLGAINWGDLGCVDVEARRSLLRKGGALIAVVIEEASPDAVGLHAFVGDYLEIHGHPEVLVETAW